MSKSYNADGTLRYLGDEFDFGACPNPNCKKFNKPFKSFRSASGHFGQKPDCHRIQMVMETEKELGEKKESGAKGPKRLKVNMPNETNFGEAPPILSQVTTSSAYRPLYTQTSTRIPDPSIPITPFLVTTADSNSNQYKNGANDTNELGDDVSFPVTDNIEGIIAAPEGTGGGRNVNNTGQATLPILPEEGSARLDPGVSGKYHTTSLYTL